MTPKDLLSKPSSTLSSVWKAACSYFGETFPTWEAETIRMMLDHKGIPVTEALMAKLLAAQTVTQSEVWLYDYDALFAFALACDGIAASTDHLHHPTVEQLCWGINELKVLIGRDFTGDEGFDPDRVDPAIAILLHEDGYFIAPKELQFVQDELNAYTQCTGIKSTVKRWEELDALSLPMLMSKGKTLADTPEGVQLRRLADCKLFVAEREEQRVQDDRWS